MTFHVSTGPGIATAWHEEQHRTGLATGPD